MDAFIASLLGNLWFVCFVVSVPVVWVVVSLKPFFPFQKFFGNKS